MSADVKVSKTLPDSEVEVIPPHLAAIGKAVLYLRNLGATNSATFKLYTGPDGVAFAAAKYTQLERDATTGRAKPGATGIVVATSSTLVVYLDDLNGYLTVRGVAAAATTDVEAFLVFEQQGA